MDIIRCRKTILVRGPQTTKGFLMVEEHGHPIRKSEGPPSPDDIRYGWHSIPKSHWARLVRAEKKANCRDMTGTHADF